MKICDTIQWKLHHFSEDTVYNDLEQALGGLLGDTLNLWAEGEVGDGHIVITYDRRKKMFKVDDIYCDTIRGVIENVSRKIVRSVLESGDKELMLRVANSAGVWEEGVLLPYIVNVWANEKPPEARIACEEAGLEIVRLEEALLVRRIDNMLCYESGFDVYELAECVLMALIGA